MMDVEIWKLWGPPLCKHSHPLKNLCPQKHPRLPRRCVCVCVTSKNDEPRWLPDLTRATSWPYISLAAAEPDARRLVLSPGWDEHTSIGHAEPPFVIAVWQERALRWCWFKNSLRKSMILLGSHTVSVYVIPRQLTCIKIKRTTKASCLSMFHFIWT